MGFRVSWIARLGASVEELLHASQRHLSGERLDFPDLGFYLLELTNSKGVPWVVLIADGSDNYGDIEEDLAEALSTGGNETLYFWCSDTVMATELKCFRNGSLVWSVEYDCENDSKRPILHGDVPSVANEILEGLRSQQESDAIADSLYNLTSEVGRRLIGFRHDSKPETDDPEPFQVLAR